MTKEQFLEKHELTDQDWIDLKRYENMRKSGKMNMFHYLANMQKHKNGKRLAKLIMSNGFYKEFLETLEAEANANKLVDMVVEKYHQPTVKDYIGYCTERGLEPKYAENLFQYAEWVKQNE